MKKEIKDKAKEKKEKAKEIKIKEDYVVEV